MSPPQAPSSMIPCSFIVLVIIASSLLQLGSTVDERFANCGNITCGNMTVSYPLRIAGKGDYCGLQEYELECQENNLTATISSWKYRVLDVVWEKQSLTIVRMDLLENKCPQEQGDFLLDFKLFNYTAGDSNATILYNCDSQLSLSNYNYNCSTSSGSQANFWEITPDYSGYGPSCSSNITVPVLKSSISDLLNNATDAGQALEHGFEVKWSLDMEECKNCVGSGGRCGYNTTVDEFSCFCSSGAYGSICPGPATGYVPTSSQAPASKVPSNSSKDSKTGLKVGIGLASGGGMALIFITLFLFVRYRNRKKLSESYAASRSISSAFSSRTDFEKGDLYYGLPVFDYDELREATNNFDPQKELGDGGFGTVFYGKLRDGRAVAVKRLYENNYKRVEQFMNEIDILARLRHPNLVILYGCTSRQSHRLLLVYEYVPNGTVADHLHGDLAKPGSLPWSTRLNIGIETASALVYLHATDIIHRDVKTNNILLDENFSVKVADFGLSRLFPFNVTHVSTAPQGTPGYVDPEYHQCYQLTEKSDVYSFGVVLMELISSLPAVDITRHRHEINLSTMAINKIHNHALHELVDPNLGFGSNCDVRKMITAVAELGFRCLQNVKDMRPSMAEVLSTLKDIQKRGTDGEKNAVENDDAAVLRANPPSPDSVMAKFISTSTTPNMSS